MRRFLFIAVLLMIVAPLGMSQGGNTTVIAIIRDPNGALYTNSQVNITFFDPGTPGKQPLLNGSTFQTTYTIFATDSFGAFTQSVADNGIIDSSSGTVNTQWSFRVIYSDRLTSFVYTTPINCAANIPTTCVNNTIDISAQLQAVAALLPSQAGGGGSFVVRAPPCTSTIGFQMAGTFPTTANTAFKVGLTCNVTTTSITQAGGGGIQIGAIAQFTLTQDSIGGRLFNWPANFIDQPSIQAAANATTNASFWFDGIGWHAQTFPASGGGGGNSAGVSGDVQKSNGTGGFTVAGINDNGTTIKVSEDVQTKGPNPAVDGTAYGMRAVSQTVAPAVPGITVSCTNGSPNVTLSSASTFQNKDGVALYGCGPSTVNTPAAPVIRSIVASGQTGTLMGVTAPAGATTYCYQLLSRTLMGGTSPSPEACTATGPASLGPQSVSITSVALSNNQATYTTSSAHGLVAGALVVITGISTTEVLGASASTSSIFNGWFTVASTADNTHFVVNLMQDTRNGAVAAGTGGTVNYWNGIEVKGAETTNNYQYYVYGRVTGGTKTLIGAMLPQNHALTLGGFPDLFYLLWDDFGSTVSTFPLPPPYIPTTVPVGSTNDMLSTTIVSGAGTTSLVLANNANATNSGQTILVDSSIGLLAAATASKAIGGWVRIPSTNGLPFVLNAPIVMPTGVNTVVISQDGPVWINEPIQFPQALKWKQGTPSTAVRPGFSQQVQQVVTCNRASPCFYSLTDLYIDDLAFNEQSANGSVMYLQDGGSIPTSKFTNVSWIGYTGGTSYSNISAVFRGGGAVLDFVYNTLTASQNSSLVAVTPGMWFNQPPNLKFDHFYMSGVGTAIYPNLQGAGDYLKLNETYCQGCYMPKFSILNSVGPVWVSANNDISDTGFNGPLIGNYAGSKLILNGFAAQGVTGVGGGSSGPSIGQQVNNLNLDGYNIFGNSYFPPGSTGAYNHNSPISVHDGTFGKILLGLDYLDRSTGVGTGYSIFSTTSDPAAPTCSTPAGGSLNSATFTVHYAPVFLGNGSEGNPSLSCSVTTSPGNQTITATVPSAVPGVNNQYGWYMGPYGNTHFCGVFGSSLTITSGVGGIPCGSLGLGDGPVAASGGPAGFHASTSWAQTNVLGLSSFTSTATVPRSVIWADLAGTPALINAAQTWTANQSFSNGTELRFFSTNATNYAGFKGGASTTNLVWLFPTTDSSGTQCLASNGSLQLSFTACSGGTGTPGGANTQVQYNNSGSFGGSTNLTWISPALSIGTAAGATGQLKYVGTTSGTVTTQSQDAAGTWTFKWPATAGTAGFPMVTDGTGIASWSLLGLAGGGTNSGAGAFTNNQLVGVSAGALASLTGTLTGANPVLKLTSGAVGNVPFALDTPASPSADVFDVNINTVKTAWIDNLGIWHAPSYTASGAGALALSGTEGTCPTPTGGIDILCIGDIATHTIKSSLNGAAYKDNAQFSNSGPAAHGVCLVGAIFPQLNCTSAGLSGQAFVSAGAGADGFFGVLGAVGGGTGNATNTLHGVGMGQGTAALNFSSAGTTGQPFLSGGAGADGAYGALNLAGGGSIVTGILPLANVNANIVTVTGAITPNNCVKWSSATVITDSGGTCGGAGGSARLDQLLGGTATNTINSTIFPQIWNWALTGSTTAMKFGENTAATGSSNILFQISTLNTSTATPFRADSNGNGVILNSSGLFTKVGTGAIDATVLSGIVPCANQPAETGDITTSAGSCATTIAANAVTAAKSAVVLTRRECDIAVGDTSGAAITNAQLGPQKRVCKIPFAATVVEIDVSSDAGTPNVIVGRSRCTTFTANVCTVETRVNLTSAALAAATGGFDGCSNTGGTTGLDGGTTCSATLQNTGLNIGDYLELVSGTAGGTAKLMTIHIVYTVN